MKLSIWRQFSSNHSGFFMVIGEFKDVESAEAAYHELRQILIDIDRWHRENPEESARLAGNESPYPPEREAAARYGVTWPQQIDWTDWAHYHFLSSPRPEYRQLGERAAEIAAIEIDNAVRVVGNLVKISNPDQTWMTIEPFASIVRKLGGGPVFALDFETVDEQAAPVVWWDAWGIRLVCTAPDEAAAQTLVDTIQVYLADTRRSDERPVPPWDDLETNFARAMQEPGPLNRRQLEILLETHQRQMSWIVEPYRTRERKKRVAIDSGSVARQGVVLALDLQLVNDLTLAALIAYLAGFGCTNFKLALTGPEVGPQ